MTEDDAHRRATIAKKVWQLLVQKDPGILCIENIRTSPEIKDVLPEDWGKDQQTSELTSILDELKESRLIYLTDKIFSCQRKAGVRLDANALTTAVQKGFIPELPKEGEPLNKNANAWQALLKWDTQYLAAVMSLYQSKASGFASLFIAVVFGLYALLAVMCGFYSSPFLRTNPLVFSLPLVPLLHVSIGCAVALLWCLACLIGWQYYQYTRLADYVNKSLYDSNPLRDKFVKITTPWEGSMVRPASVFVMGSVLFFTAVLALSLWLGFVLSLLPFDP